MDRYILQGVPLKRTLFQPWATGLEFWHFSLKIDIQVPKVCPFDRLLPDFKVLLVKVYIHDFLFYSEKSKVQNVQKINKICFSSFNILKQKLPSIFKVSDWNLFS